MRTRPNFLDIISSASVTPEMLGELNEAVAENRDQAVAREPDDFMWVLFRVFGHRLDVHTLSAIMFRMEALARLIEAGHTKDWQSPGKGKSGAVLVHEALLTAAARAPLILSRRRGVPPKFDIAEFRDLALLAAEPEGQA